MFAFRLDKTKEARADTARNFKVRFVLPGAVVSVMAIAVQGAALRWDGQTIWMVVSKTIWGSSKVITVTHRGACP